MGNKDTRERVRQRRQSERRRSWLRWGGIAVVVLLIGGSLIWKTIRPPAGEAVPVLTDSSHVPVGAEPGPYNTDPPTSGSHYDSPLDAGFYDEEMATEVGPYPAGYLVHNLEHGYVIFWYNCEILDDVKCGELKVQLQDVIDDANNIKVVAFPWTSIDVPVVATSWGRRLDFEIFDAKQASQFVSINRNRAPEPQAP